MAERRPSPPCASNIPSSASRREAAAFRDIRAERDPRPRIALSRNEKGGVVRRPFSKLQAWLIAVSPRRESLSLSARSRQGLSVEGARSLTGTMTWHASVCLVFRAKTRERSGVAAKPPLSVPCKLLRRRNCSSPLSNLTRAAAASLPRGE